MQLCKDLDAMNSKQKAKNNNTSRRRLHIIHVLNLIEGRNSLRRKNFITQRRLVLMFVWFLKRQCTSLGIGHHTI